MAAGGIKALSKIQLGRETTAGTEANATVIWRGVGSLKDNLALTFVEEHIGSLSGYDRSYISKYAGAINMSATPATYEQVNHIFEAGIKTDAAAAEGSGYLYEYTGATTAAPTIKTYTIEAGDNIQEEQGLYGFVSDFTLSGAAGEAMMMSANWITRQVQTGSFTGALSVPTVEEILVSKGSVYIDAASGTAGATQVSDTLLDFTLNYTTGIIPKWTADGGSLDYQFIQYTMPEVTLDVTFEHNSTAVAEKAAWRAETGRQIRLLFTGSALTTAGTTYSTKALQIDLVGKWETFEELGDMDGNVTVSGTFRSRYNATAALFSTISLVNNLSAVP
jgi:hypothetical protein